MKVFSRYYFVKFVPGIIRESKQFSAKTCISGFIIIERYHHRFPARGDAIEWWCWLVVLNLAPFPGFVHNMWPEIQ